MKRKGRGEVLADKIACAQALRKRNCGLVLEVATGCLKEVTGCSRLFSDEEATVRGIDKFSVKRRTRESNSWLIGGGVIDTRDGDSLWGWSSGCNGD